MKLLSFFRASAIGGAIGGLTVWLSSCQPVSSPPPATPTPPQTSTAPMSPQAPMPANQVPVVIYRMDDQCTKLVSKSVPLPKEKTLERAIGTILDQANTPDFTITDYQVAKANSSATITLRIAPGSKRSFASMSTCEQMAFFGAMRETIVQRKEWGIREVKFTDGKKEISF